MLEAEFRGPGARQNFEDSGDDYDLDADSRARNSGGKSGRIILLGDGTEVLTDGDDHDMLENEEEDKDLDSQVIRGDPKHEEVARGTREETPGPESHSKAEIITQEGPSSVQHPPGAPNTLGQLGASDVDPSKSKPIPESAIPEKLVNPPTSSEK